MYVKESNVKLVSVVFITQKNTNYQRSGGRVVDNTLDISKIDPGFSCLSDETLNRGPVSV